MQAAVKQLLQKMLPDQLMWPEKFADNRFYCQNTVI